MDYFVVLLTRNRHYLGYRVDVSTIRRAGMVRIIDVSSVLPLLSNLWSVGVFIFNWRKEEIRVEGENFWKSREHVTKHQIIMLLKGIGKWDSGFFIHSGIWFQHLAGIQPPWSSGYDRGFTIPQRNQAGLRSAACFTDWTFVRCFFSFIRWMPLRYLDKNPSC